MPDSTHTHSHRPSSELKTTVRAVGIILFGGVVLSATLAMLLFAYAQTGRISASVALSTGLFAIAVLMFIDLLFAAGFRIFGYVFRAIAVVLAAACIWSLAYFISETSGIFRNLGLAFALLATVPLVVFYRTTFSAHIRSYLMRKHWMRVRMR